MSFMIELSFADTKYTDTDTDTAEPTAVTVTST